MARRLELLPFKGLKERLITGEVFSDVTGVYPPLDDKLQSSRNIDLTEWGVGKASNPLLGVNDSPVGQATIRTLTMRNIASFSNSFGTGRYIQRAVEQLSF